MEWPRRYSGIATPLISEWLRRLAGICNLLHGESYYIAETKSIKRIIDAAKECRSVLCVMDEVLRGTNTVERIAAASVVLEELSGLGVLCFAATHDIELCDLLQNCYSLYHFEDQIVDGEMLFDYVLRAGKATTRNAINLLALIGFDQRIVSKAHARADQYMSVGVWED